MGNRNFETTICFARARADCRIVCGGCAYERIVTGQELIRAFAAVIPIPAAEKRLKCSRCGEKRARMIPVPTAR
ncbi:hypothetical protein E2493_13575 [Sphingomonas parva]|uniref:Uncharacterized protein n=1 Tax=Sphingomonas parva TaxID=2555898 RepID=A0A4Y8ZRJ5_9SPHN|nr:hypothetical protein [Sphingomonas parva]TFI57755.1 hypothetical protein E2493_13575 [Sphingomonas parva]